MKKICYYFRAFLKPNKTVIEQIDCETFMKDYEKFCDLMCVNQIADTADYKIFVCGDWCDILLIKRYL